MAGNKNFKNKTGQSVNGNARIVRNSSPPIINDSKVTEIIEKQLAQRIEHRSQSLQWDRSSDRKVARDIKLIHLQDGFCGFDMSSLCDQVQEILKCIGINEHYVFFESLLHLVVDLYLSPNHATRISAILHFVRHLIPGALKKCSDFIKEFFSESVFQDEDTPLFGEKFFSDLKQMFQHRSNFVMTKTWSALRLVLSYIVSIFISNDEFDDSFLKRKLPDVFHKVEFSGSSLVQLFQSLIHLIERGYQYLRTGSWTSFCYEETSVAKWMAKCDAVKMDYTNLNSPDPTKRKTPQEILDIMRRLVVEGREISKFLTPTQKKFFVTPFRDIEAISNKVHNEIVGTKFRKAPFCILVNGAPSVGKTTFTDHICDFFAKLKGFDYNEDSKYTRNFADQFYSGFKTSHQIIILDDLAFENPQKMNTLAESSMRDIIQINNNNVLTLNMADLEQKGNVYCAPKLVVGTTNCKHLNAKALFQTPHAALRRFPFVVTIKPRSEVRGASQNLELAFSGPFKDETEKVGEDWWEIDVESPVPYVSADGEVQAFTGYKSVLQTTSLSEFRRFLKKVIGDHDLDQDRVMKSFEDKKNVRYCDTCCSLQNKCVCQSEVFCEKCVKSQENCVCQPEFQDGFLEGKKMKYLLRFWFMVVAWTRIWNWIKSWVRYLYYNDSFFYMTLLNYIFLFADIFFWKIFGILPLSYHLFFIIFGFGLKLFKMQFNVYYIGYLFWKYCLPSNIKTWILIQMARSSAPKWLKSHWGYIRLAKGLSLISAIYGGYVVGKAIFSNKEELKSEGASDEKVNMLISKSVRRHLGVLNEEPLADENAEVQGALFSQQKDVYYNDVEKTVAMDFGSAITSWKGLPRDVVLDKISSNVVRLVCSDVLGRAKKGVGLFLRGQVLITNAHLFASGTKFTIFHPQMNHPLESKVSEVDIHIDKTRDFMFIRFRNVAPFRDIVSLIPKSKILDACCGVAILTRDKDGSMTYHQSKRCEWLGPERLNHELLDGERIVEKYIAFGINTTQKGDCGSPWVLDSPLGPCIVALHQTLSSDYAGGVYLDRDYIEKQLNQYVVQIQGGTIHHDGCDFTIMNLSPNSNLRRLENAHFYHFGTSQRRFPSSSRVVKSILYDHCIDAGFKDNFAKPVMRERAVWLNQIKHSVDRHLHVDHDLLDAAVEMFISEVIQPIPQHEFEEIKVLSDDEALNGIDGVNYIDKLPRKTSAGFPRNCSKMKYLTIMDDGKAELDPEILREFETIESIAKGGCRTMPIFMASLKDEIVTKSKRERRKTRVFTGSPMAFSMLMRKYLLSINAFIQKRRQQFECCVGVDALGPEWHEIAEFLNMFTEKFIAGDYGHYDKSMWADIVLAAGEILIELCRRASYTSEQLLIIRVLIYDLAFPVMNFDGDIIMTCGSEPSGHPLTVILNSLVGSILLRMAFINLKVPGTFKDFVKAIIYGDDNVAASILDKFNHTYLVDFFSTQGFEYTMADKETDSVPFIPFDEITFLKRNFTWSAELNRWVGPIDNSSLEKMLMYHIASGSVSQENWAVDVLNTRCREIFFHGRKPYEQAIAWSKSVVEDLGLDVCVKKSHFLPYDVVKELYNEKCEDRESLDLKERTFLQDGEVCDKCFNDDCVEINPDCVICDRCKHCRQPELTFGDFFGCFYCENILPLECDWCGKVKPVVPIMRVAVFSLYVCKTCFDEGKQTNEWSENFMDDTEATLNMSVIPEIPLAKNLVAAHIQKLNPALLDGNKEMQNEFSNNQNISAVEEQQTPSVLGKDTSEKWYSSQFQDGIQETVEFHDIVAPEQTILDHSAEELSAEIAETSVSLADFFSRPVLIDSLTWYESEGIGTKRTINPWYAFFNAATVRYKLNNWSFIKCNLHVRIVYNASPFYYGAMMVSYQPLPIFNQTFIHDDGTENILIPYSQMKGRVIMYPQVPQDHEITLPFFFPAAFLACQYAQNFVEMGKLFFNIMAPLQSANGVTGTGISIKVYAWATDVILSGPSIGLSMQDGDEYGLGPVSKPASAIANIAAKLGDVPVIGRFATATAIGARAVSNIAKLFGFTNVPVIEDQKGFHPRALPPMASTEIGFPIEKLTLDPKNELTIDHRSVGLGPLDELPVSHLVQKESWLTYVNWSTSNNVDDLLFSSAVTPQLFGISAATDPYLYMTPMCWLSTMFNFWHGDIIFKFKIVCSKYHRGRLRITYDPYGDSGHNIAIDPVSSNVTMTKIIDIAEESEVEFRIPYQQFIAWLDCKLAHNFTSSNRGWATSGFLHTPGQTNGSLTIRVHNALSAPVATSTVSVQVFVKGAENLEYGSPSSAGLENLTAATIQDGVDETVIPNKSSILTTRPSAPVDHIYLTHMGERVASLRVLLRRMSRVQTILPTLAGTNDLQISCITLNRQPLGNGYDSNGLHSVKGIIATTNDYKFNWVQGNFLSYVAPAFVANRGSVNWSICSDSSTTIAPRQITVVRDVGASSIGINNYASSGLTSSSASRFFRMYQRSTGAGSAIVNTGIDGGVSIQMPFYSKYKFAPTDIAWKDSLANRTYPTCDNFTIEVTGNGTTDATLGKLRLFLYAGAGTDYDLLYFLHVPTYGLMKSQPNAN